MRDSWGRGPPDVFVQRNTASQVFVIPGSLRAVADGSAVTSTATITIVKDGTSGAGAGTLTHISGGAYKYAPTQGETDCKIMGYVVEATGAITLAGSVRTTNADPNDAAALGLTRIDAAVTSRMATYTQPTGFLAATFPTTVASTTNITAGTITTVTTLTNLPSATTDWITAAAVSAAAVTKIQSGLSTYAGGDTSGTTTLLSRVTSTRAGYLDNLTNLDAAVSSRSTFDPTATGVHLTSAGLDLVVIESGINARQAMSAIMASAAGVLSGATTGTIVIKGGGVATTRITATTDADGNRSAITLSLPS